MPTPAANLSHTEVIQRVRAYILAHPDIHADPSAWIEGMGWDQTHWPGGAFPTAVRPPSPQLPPYIPLN